MTLTIVACIVCLYLFHYIDKEITGGKIEVVTKYSIITVLDQSYNECDVVQQISKQCPIPVGIVNELNTYTF